MNYYEHHLGDYAKDTAHLTMLEHGAYRLLLDRYYGTEQGIPDDQAHRVARARTREEKAAVDAVLAEFFTLEAGVWKNGRAEEEIAKAQVKINAAKENGKKGGRPRKVKPGSENETQQKPGGFSVGSENETQQKALQSPDTSHQTPEELPVVGEQPSGGESIAGNATRVGALCKQLRGIGIDAAPHLPVWPELLDRFTDEQIIAVEEIAKARKPGERIHLHYLVPILNEPPKAPAAGTKRAPSVENFEGREYGAGGRL